MSIIKVEREVAISEETEETGSFTSSLVLLNSGGLVWTNKRAVFVGCRHWSTLKIRAVVARIPIPEDVKIMHSDITTFDNAVDAAFRYYSNNYVAPCPGEFEQMYRYGVDRVFAFVCSEVPLEQTNSYRMMQTAIENAISVSLVSGCLSDTPQIVHEIRWL